MQIKRRKNEGSFTDRLFSRNSQVLIACGLALIFLLVISFNYYDDLIDTADEKSSMLRAGAGEIDESITIAGIDEITTAAAGDDKVENRPPKDDANGGSGQRVAMENEPVLAPEPDPVDIPADSLLHDQNAIINDLPSCGAMRHTLPVDTFDETKPAIFEGWHPPATSNWGDRDSFVKRFGDYQQYLKGRVVQPYMDSNGNQCTVSTRALLSTMKSFRENIQQNDDRDILFFTNNVENKPFLEAIFEDVDPPAAISSLDVFAKGFQVFSSMERGSSHPFHFHDAAWLGQLSGSRLWYFLPPGTRKETVGAKGNGCDYLLGRTLLPEGTTSCIQKAGEVVYFPSKWLHATCALEPFSVGVGGQGGSPSVYNQNFDSISNEQKTTETIDEQKKIAECLGDTAPSSSENDANPAAAEKEDENEKDWTWYDGNLNEYYNKLEKDEHAKRNPNKITSYAVHRWMGPDRSTLIHYKLVRAAIYELIFGVVKSSNDQATNRKLRVFDAGCGLGAGLMWMEQNEPQFELVGHTISEEQHKWIVEDLPKHSFEARLLSYDDPLQGDKNAPLFDAVYSIEAAVHSPDLKNSLKAWSDSLNPGGVIIVIDDFLSVGVPRDDPDIDLFSRSWLASAVHSTNEISGWGNELGLALVRDRDLGSEYQVIKRNYRNKAPELRDEQGRAHQGWLGSKVRQKLMVEGKISYRMIVLQKKGKGGKTSIPEPACASIPTAQESGIADSTYSITIDPVLMSGKGNKGGQKMACISSWYCCDKGASLWDELEKSRTERTGYLQLPKELFGHYLTSFSKHLTDFYRTYPASYPEGEGKPGKFLDIGGTGSVASGMKQVTSKFAHFSGPLDYWVLDLDKGAKQLSNAVACDIDNCPEAVDCGYDVTFSHTVLEHASRPWQSFDTIARITKKGGLTLHLVPWSYQYHATPDDNYRFSHKALRTLLEDRGFEVLDVGYDICTQPENILKNRKDEHFETIWLTYIVGRKL